MSEWTAWGALRPTETFPPAISSPLRLRHWGDPARTLRAPQSELGKTPPEPPWARPPKPGGLGWIWALRTGLNYNVVDCVVGTTEPALAPTNPDRILKPWQAAQTERGGKGAVMTELCIVLVVVESSWNYTLPKQPLTPTWGILRSQSELGLLYKLTFSL